MIVGTYFQADIKLNNQLLHMCIFVHVLHCTVVDDANIAPGKEVDKDTSRYSSASRSKDSFTPAHVF